MLSSRGKNFFGNLFILPLFFSVIFIIFLFLSLGSKREDLPSALIGKSLPVFSLKLLEASDKQLDNSYFINNGLSIINFWASWCRPCREEMVLLQSLSDKGFNLYGINVRDNINNARRFLGLFGNPFIHTAIDKNGSFSIDMGVYGYPETFIIDDKGYVIYRHIGILTEDVLEKKFYPLLSDS